MSALQEQSPVELSFPRGLVGFEALSRFRLVEDPTIAPFGRLESIDVPAIGFVVVDPGSLSPDDAERAAVMLAGARGAARAELGDDTTVDFVRLVVAIDRGRREVAVNLLAPIAVDRTRGLAAQVVLHESGLPVRHVIAALVTEGSRDVAPPVATESNVAQEGVQP